MSVFCKRLFISIASLSRIEVNFWNQYSCMPSRPGVLVFLRVALSESRCIFAFAPSSSSSNFFVAYPFGFFCYVLFVPIFYFEIVLFPCHPVVGLSSCILPLLAGRICFLCFGMSCFARIWEWRGNPLFSDPQRLGNHIRYFFRVFFVHSCGILIIFKQIFLTHGQGLNRYSHSRSNWTQE